MYPSASDFSIFGATHTARIVERGIQHLKTEQPRSVWFVVPERDYSAHLRIDQSAAKSLALACCKGEPIVPNQVLRAALLKVAGRAEKELGYSRCRRPGESGSAETFVTLTIRPR